MSTTTHTLPAMTRVSTVVVTLLQRVLMIAGVVFLMGLIGIQAGHAGFIESLKAFLPADEELVLDVPAAIVPVVDEHEAELSPRMRGALDYVSKRYRVSNDALEPIFATALATGRELKIDPLLIIAVIGIESGFNPFSQSVYGARGLMQVVPRFHMDKLPDEADQDALLDPVINVQVGARVLNDSIRRFGGIETGLQQFGGALNDSSRRYALKVLAEKQRLEQATQRARRA